MIHEPPKRSALPSSSAAPGSFPGGWKPRLRRAEASHYLLTVHGIACAHATLAKYATNGNGPSFHSVRSPGAKRGIPYYSTEELDVWALKRLGRLRRSTSDKDEEQET